MNLERDKDYFWQSPKDGMFYLLHFNSINNQGSYLMFIKEVVHFGYLSFAPKEKIGYIKTFHKNNINFSSDYEKLMLDFLLESVLTKSHYDYQRRIEIRFDLYDLLMLHPDVYLRNIDRLLMDETFTKILNGKIKRPLS